MNPHRHAFGKILLGCLQLTTVSCLRANEHFEPEDLSRVPPDMYERPECTKHGNNMVQVVHGIFTMGSNELANEQKPNQQQTRTFKLDATEVTVASYRSCVEAGACTLPAVNPDGSCFWGDKSKDLFPINCVNYEQAKQYCAYVCSRLPTEIEWEYAARGEDNSVYPWGNDPASPAKCCQSTTYCPVGTKPPTLLGHPAKDGGRLFDMAGNVWEWTSSAWPCVYPLKQDDPDCGSKNVTDRVLRGGYSFALQPTSWRSAYRYHLPAAGQAPQVGFRCARSVEN